MLVVVLLARASQVAAQVRHEFTEVHMGMPVRIVLHAPDDSTARAAARAAFRRIAQLEDILSDYRSSSELRRLERNARTPVIVSEPLFTVLRRALDIAPRTDGAFDPTIGLLSALWRTARRMGVPPASASIDSARALVRWQFIQLDTLQRSVHLLREGMRLDLGGIAKGYILQCALGTIATSGAPAALIEAGGDVVVSGPPPGRAGWTIDVPGADAEFAARAASLSHAAIATSGPTFQYLDLDGTRYSHVIDPRTGRAITQPYIAYVIASDAATADALATALSVLGHAGVGLLRERFPTAHMYVTEP